MNNYTNDCSLKQKKLRLFAHVVTTILIFLVASASHASDSDLSIVFIGNSITRHGPAPAVGWIGNWGMAASAMEKDYVWQTARQLPVRSVQTFNIAPLETAPKTARLLESMLTTARQSQLVIVQLGDNVKSQNISDFNLAYVQLLANVKPARGTLICLSTWYRKAAVDVITEQACKYAGGVYVQIGDIKSNPGHDASDQRLDNPGVRSHPGDMGMAEIAKRIVTAWKGKAYSWQQLPDK